MKTIWKFELTPSNVITVLLPAGAHILCLQSLDSQYVGTAMVEDMVFHVFELT